MAILSTPAVNNINAFDPSMIHNFDFTYSGNQVIKNRAVIIDNDTYETVYDNLQSGLRLSHSMPENTLTPGKSYTIQIQVYDIDENASHLSEPVLFYCYTTPKFNLNINNGDIISSAKLELNLSYIQQEGETLQQYNFYVYKYDKSLYLSSATFYTSDNLSYTFYGLQNEQIYYVRCIGTTSHGMDLDTGYVEINVQYFSIPANVLFEVTNNSKNGYIILQSGIIDIGYITQNDNYYFEDGSLILFDNVLTYNSGINIPDNFIILVIAKKIPFGTFLYVGDNENTNRANLSIIEICDRYYCKLLVPSVFDNTLYVELPKAQLVDTDNNIFVDTFGNSLMLSNTEYEDNYYLVFELKRERGVYGLRVYFKEEELIQKEVVNT